jgi:DNA modification methylase
MSVYLDDGDVRLHHGDALDVLRTMPDCSVQMIASSPPFWGLRDYGCDGQIGLEETPDEWCARLVGVYRECRRVLRDDGVMFIEIGDSYARGGSQNAPGKSSVLGSGNGRVGMYADVKWPDPKPIPSGLKAKDLVGQPWLLAFALRADGWYLRSEIIWARPNPMPESVTDRPTKAHSTVFLLSKRPRYYWDADAIREPHQEPERSGSKPSSNA